MKVLKGYLIEIRPLPMIAALTGGLIGFAFAHEFSLNLLFPFLFSIFLALFSAHLKDTYVDYYVYKEDVIYRFGRFDSSYGLLSKNNLVNGILFSTVVFSLLTIYLTSFRNFYLIFGILGLLLSLTYSDKLSKNPVGACIGYPLGVSLALIGGYYLQTSMLNPIVITFSLILLLFLSSGKIIEDMIDMKHDKFFNKNTIPVLLGFKKNKIFGYMLAYLSLIMIATFSLLFLTELNLIGVLLSFVTIFYSSKLKVEKGIYIFVAGIYIAMLSTFVSLYSL